MNTVIHVSSIYLMTHSFNRSSHLFRPVFFNKKYTYNKTSPQQSPLKQRPLGLVPKMAAIRSSTALHIIVVIISFNIIKKYFGVLCQPLIYLFQLSREKGVFPYDLKIAKVTPIYEAGDSSDVSNCRTISVLPCFSKILESLMYNRLFKYLKESKIPYEK